MKKKRRGLKIAVAVIVFLLVAGLGVLGYFLYEQANSGLFFEETKINGYDVAGKTCKEVLLMMERDYSAPVGLMYSVTHVRASHTIALTL